ncbi:MAG: helix-turn-helix domain-containing protein [Phycisphaerales bacterium]
MTIQPINPEIVRAIVLDDCKVDLSDFMSSTRAGRIVFARAVIAVVLRDHTEFSYPEIGNLIGKRHSTIIGAENRLRAGDHDSDACVLLGCDTTAMEYANYVWVRADEKSKVYHDDNARFYRLGDGPEKGAA